VTGGPSNKDDDGSGSDSDTERPKTPRNGETRESPAVSPRSPRKRRFEEDLEPTPRTGNKKPVDVSTLSHHEINRKDATGRWVETAPRNLSNISLPDLGLSFEVEKMKEDGRNGTKTSEKPLGDTLMSGNDDPIDFRQYDMNRISEDNTQEEIMAMLTDPFDSEFF
jgi:hypothetical protein